MTTAPDAAAALPDYDSDTWIEVPLEFPVGTLATVEEWADTLTADAMRATAADAPIRAGFRESAIAIAKHPTGLTSRRFWYFPLMAHTSSIVQYFELPRLAGIDDVLIEFLGTHEHRSTDPVVTELQTSRGERLIRVAFLVSETPGVPHSAVFAVIRLARLADDTVDIFELRDEDLVTASQLISDLEVLAYSVGRGPFSAPVDGDPAPVELAGGAS